MPLFRSTDDVAPAWCEMRYFEIINLVVGDTRTFERKYPKEKLIVSDGQCRIRIAGQIVQATSDCNLDLNGGEEDFEISDVEQDTIMIRMCGRWGDETGGSGLFSVEKCTDPKDTGDPVDYPKETDFDSHYHDCDEYWIIFKGRGIAVSEGKVYEVGPGDCIATGMGHHHDFPGVFEPVEAVYFETTLEGKRRRGHLWNHTHGQAQPQLERV